MPPGTPAALPPGWRGYGAKDYIEHPDTPARQAEVEGIRSRIAPQGRFAVQQALLPYEKLLPERFRGRNERIDERLPESMPTEPIVEKAA